MASKHFLRVFPTWNVHRKSCHVRKWTFETHSCGTLTKDHVGQKVTLTGWIQNTRMNNRFIWLRDKTGIIQLMVNENDIDVLKSLEEATIESSLCIEGQVFERPDGQSNKKLVTGDIEVLVENVKMLNSSKPKLPFYIKPFNEAHEPLRMKYRYLDLRNQWLQNNLKVRSDLIHKMRNFLYENHFTEIETPTLFRRTPGGAREFVVPTHQAGHFYSLVQSPQQFKQLLMVGGIERYYQVARCYRDEGSRPDRQPEFTQLDIELSFTDGQKIQNLVEELLIQSWPTKITKTPFLRLTYHEAMSKYGSDKPDLRISNDIQNVAFHEEKFIKALVFEKSQLSKDLSKSAAKSIEKDIKKQFESTIISFFEIDNNCDIKTNANKLLPRQDSLNLKVNSGDFGFLALGPEEIKVQQSLGKIRSLLIENNYLTVNSDQLEFLWVIDFPMFLPKENGEDGLEAAHHPFTRPNDEDIHLLKIHPEQIRAQHYDLVLNGYEIGGGSMRIHELELQRYILEDILKEDTSQLNHMLEALSVGCPPHGGIALGLDRLIGILCKANSIRDVIAFPKTTGGKDLMSEAPAKISDEEKEYYHLKK